MSNIEHDPTAEEYRDAAHYWQTKYAATEAKLAEALKLLEEWQETAERLLEKIETYR